MEAKKMSLIGSNLELKWHKYYYDVIILKTRVPKKPKQTITSNEATFLDDFHECSSEPVLALSAACSLLARIGRPS